MPTNHPPNRYLICTFCSRHVNRSAKLWRFLTIEKYAWLLEKSSLWHTRLDCLGDPFEGSLPKAFVERRNAGTLPDHYPKAGIPPVYQSMINEADIYSKFATCWHESRDEKAFMWKLYSSEHAGVAIVTTPQRIQDAVDLTPYNEGVISPVEYSDFEKRDDMVVRPISKGFGRRSNPAFLKRISFRHEREVRGMIYWSDYSKIPKRFDMHLLKDGFKLYNPKGISVKVDIDRLVKEIYISPLAPDFVGEVIKSMAARHGLEKRIKLSKLAGLPVF